MQKVVVSAGNGNGVDTNEAARMSGVISHPAGAIRPGTAPFSILYPAIATTLWRSLVTPLHPLLIRETRNPEANRFFDSYASIVIVATFFFQR